MTCNVPADFAVPDVVTSIDPGAIDVGVPIAFPPGTISGNDMSQVKFYYDADGDVLYVGIDTYTIAGDVDNDGNPGGTGPILSGLGGTDLPDFGGTEGFSVYFDIDQDGIMDVIAGVSGTTSLAGYSVNRFSGSVFAPSFAYGSSLPANVGAVCGSPSATGPDIEFTIENWSTLPVSSGTDASTVVAFTAFVGSLSDAGIGEDFNPGAGSTTTVPVGYCGDGREGPGEQCDDGNLIAGDGCSPVCEPESCTLTIGYWKTHHSDAHNPSQEIPWPIPESTLMCGYTWLDILHTPPAGNKFFVLAHQWIGATLNVASGSGVPSSVQSALTAGAAILADCSVSAGESSAATSLTALLDSYNNGAIGVGHCGDQFCGDAIVVPPEQCDDGNDMPMDGCTSDCRTEYCGDGVTQPGEQCDDGDLDNNDACTTACTDAVCGDGYMQPGEECDDGDADNGDACTTSCTTAECGDGYQQPGEECDDGNPVDTDACTTACTTAECGDGYMQPGEECDDGDLDNNDACTTSCTTAECGDGYMQPGEECDDGNPVDTDACTTACTTAECGDGYMQPGEQCDDGNDSDKDGCTTTCRSATCGDGFVQPGEQCDDGNDNNKDGCTTSCTTARCGDGYVGPGEACDDGDLDNYDMCTTACTPAACGDGYMQPGEECDDGNPVDTDACTTACTTAECGDGYMQPGEQCDDGNDSDKDGCTTKCRSATCGDGFVQPGEQCDDGNDNNKDGCTTSCTTARCGDGYVGPGEACDDGDLDNYDMCTTACTPAACGDGYMQPGEECDDGNLVDGDGCSATCESAVCGDGYLDMGESCDDGNLIPGDGCDATCQGECVDADSQVSYEVTNLNDYRAFWINGLYGGGAIEIAVDAGATFDIDWSTGTAQFSGTGYEAATPSRLWSFDVSYQYRGQGADGVGSAGPQIGSYVPTPSELANWLYFDLTTGLMTRTDNGSYLVFSEYPTDGSKPTQMGRGANFFDGDWGFAHWLKWSYFNSSGSSIRKGFGDINADIEPVAGPCVCGDGDMGAGEVCDDGNPVDTDACTNDCELAVCGDGIMGPGEECDDGNYDTHDACTNDCTVAVCGDGIVGPGEICDDGNMSDYDMCRTDCQPAECGDGFMQPGEECDDGNMVPTDYCTNYCTDAYCGDGIVGPGEDCDDADHDNNDGCTDTCSSAPICEDLGVAQEYNVFVFGDYLGGYDIGGKLAAGDDVQMQSFAINYATPGGQAMVAGGDIDFAVGQIWGDGFYGGTATVVGTQFVGGDLYAGVPVNFPFAEAKLNQLCNQLEVLPSNATTQIQAFPGVNLITLHGIDGAVNVFELNAATLLDAGALTLDVPVGSTTLVKLSGLSLEFSNFGTVLNGATPGRILWLSCDATDIDIHNYGFKGSLLAPKASVTFNNGSFDGTLVAKNAYGNGEFHSYPFSGELPCPTCGDSVVQAPENCDDGGLSSGDGCSAVCRTEGCGDGFIQAGEECDDGNLVSGDGCDATCVSEYHPVCGDGVVNVGEECDDGNNDDDDGCSAACGIEYCGDGVVQTGEECDDANHSSGDGCNSACQIESGTCGNGHLDPGETCDDGDIHDGDGCSSVCQIESAWCGDGMVGPGEQCDDGNPASGDGCSASCATEDCVPDLGTAGAFNVFVATTYRDGQDVAGPVGAGELIWMRGFSVGFASPGGPVMVSGDTVDVDSGTVWGDAYYGATLSWGGPTSVGFPMGGSFILGNPVDFGAAMHTAAQLSFALHALPNGGSSTMQWGNLEIVGADPDFNVIDVDAGDLAHTSSVSIHAPAGAKVVVNVRGSSATIMNLGMNLNGLSADDVLFNFPEATSVQMGGLGFQGSILAPFADVNFYNGQVRGQIVAYSLLGSTEFYWNPWSGSLDCASWGAFRAAQIAAGTWGSTF